MSVATYKGIDCYLYFTGLKNSVEFPRSFNRYRGLENNLLGIQELPLSASDKLYRFNVSAQSLTRICNGTSNSDRLCQGTHAKSCISKNDSSMVGLVYIGWAYLPSNPHL
jgi:rRNA pseudouridine-1189 N-methylase Emg1 (Nep1/Mra1 family)